MFLYVPICSYMFLDVPYGAVLPPCLAMFQRFILLSDQSTPLWKLACVRTHYHTGWIHTYSNIHQRNLKDNLSAFSLPHLVSNIWINMKLVLAPHVPVSLFSCFCPLRETFDCMELHVVELCSHGALSRSSLKLHRAGSAILIEYKL